MTATYHFSSVEEISVDLLESIKAAFKQKSVTITIEEEMDTTDYLMASEANKRAIKESLEQFERGEIIRLKPHEL